MWVRIDPCHRSDCGVQDSSNSPTPLIRTGFVHTRKSGSPHRISRRIQSIFRAIRALHQGPRIAPSISIQLSGTLRFGAGQRTTPGQGRPRQTGPELDQVMEMTPKATNRSGRGRETGRVPPVRRQRQRRRQRNRATDAAKESTNAHCHRGDDLAADAPDEPRQKMAGKVQAKRATTIISVTPAVTIRISPSGNAFDFSNNQPHLEAVSRNSNPSIR